MQTRYYDPETGCFISQDDVSFPAPDIINGLNLSIPTGLGVAMTSAGGTAVVVTSSVAISIPVGAIIAGAAAAGVLLMAKDPFIKYLEKGITENQKQKFSEEIHKLKDEQGRGGADNLLKEVIREIAEWVIATFK